jgi:enoyl-CoA hydratase
MKMTPHFSTLDVLVTGHVAEITLNRPAALNSFTHVMHVELKQAFLAVREQVQIRAIILAANGKSFSAGGDFDLILASRDDVTARQEMQSEARPLLMAIADSPIPVIAALQGDAVGLGATIALGADAIVAARLARISDPHVVIGLAAGDGGSVLWPLHIGLLRAKRYLLTGDRLTAEDAYAMGLVTDLVDTPEQVLEAARQLAGRIAALPPLAVQGTKRALNQIFRNRVEEVFEQALAAEMAAFTSEDVAEAIAAIKARRKPIYKGQ